MGIDRVDLPGTYISTLPELKPVLVRWMSQHVTNHATDADDRLDLLGVLGLPGGQIRTTVTSLACGHPSTEGRRSVRYGVECRACSRQQRAVKRLPANPETCDARRGSAAGYARHIRAGEFGCAECVAGATRERAERKAAS